jgi:hypothetical protein
LAPDACPQLALQQAAVPGRTSQQILHPSSVSTLGSSVLTGGQMLRQMRLAHMSAENIVAASQLVTRCKATNAMT